MPVQGQVNPNNPKMTWDANSSQWVPIGFFGANSGQLGVAQPASLTPGTSAAPPGFGTPASTASSLTPPANVPGPPPVGFGSSPWAVPNAPGSTLTPQPTGASFQPSVLTPEVSPQVQGSPEAGGSTLTPQMQTSADIGSTLSGIASIGSGIASGITGSGAINSATQNLVNGGNTAINTITQGGQAAGTTLGDIWKQIQTMFAPYTAAGATGLGNASSMAGTFAFNPSDLQNDPGYLFRLQQGEAAVNAAEAAAGNRYSPVASKDISNYVQDAASQEYQNAFNRSLTTFNTNFNTNEQLAQMGLSATGSLAQSGNTYGTNLAAIQTGDAKAIADLQTQIANARAAGNIAQANNLQGTLNSIVSGVQQTGILKSIAGGGGSTNIGDPGTGVGSATPGGGPGANPGLSGSGASGTGGEPVDPITGAAAAGAGATGAALSGGAGAAGLTPTTSVVIPGVTTGVGAGAGAGATSGALAGTEAGAAAGGEAGAAGAAGSAAAGAGEAGAAGAGEAGAAGASGGLSGALSSIGSLLTNPITIGLGAALAGALIWKSTQVHPVADTFVNQYQNPFGQHLGQVVDGFDQALASGQLTKAQAQTAYNATQTLINQFMTDGENFAKQGDKETIIWKQATRTMAQDFGGSAVPGGNGLYAPDWSKILGKMQTEIAGLS